MKKWRNLKRQVLLAGTFGTLVVTMQNCGDQNLNASMMFSTKFGSGNALVYGSSESDQKFLQQKLIGNPNPSLNEIYNNWKMISGPSVFNSITKVPKTGQPNQYCSATGKDAVGNWLPTQMPSKQSDGTSVDVTINPNYHDTCVNGVQSTWFAALSWGFYTNTSGEYLYNATNSDNFNGFISNIKTDNYTHEATLSADDADNDELAMIIAMSTDSAGRVHTLSAARSGGGYTSLFKVPNPSGTGTVTKYSTWYFIHKIDNATIKIYHTDAHDKEQSSWKGKTTKVKVERSGNIISAWTTDFNSPVYKQDNAMTLDLEAEPALKQFLGPQHYGYAIRSQPKATFSDIKFDIPGLQGNVYDLKTGNVWRYNSKTNKYDLDPSAEATRELGYPKVIGNPETQKNYGIYTQDRWDERSIDL